MKFTNFLMSVMLPLVVVVEATEPLFLYSNTRICSRHRSIFCLAYDYEREMVTLDRRHRLRFDIETVQRINMNINRVYTYAKDKATRKKVKSCLIRKELPELGLTGIGLAPCDTDERELVLAVTEPETEPISPNYLRADEFILRELSYLEGSEHAPVCVTLTHKHHSQYELVEARKDLHTGTPVALEACSTLTRHQYEYGQELKARYFNKDESVRVQEQEDTALAGRIGRFCSTVKPDLCLGISLTNGTVLDKNKFIQVKNLTKNSMKDLDELKMEWYLDLENNRMASAAEMDYCMEAIYGAPIGRNRLGKEQFDDILHLGACDPNRIVSSETNEAFRGLPASEFFYMKEIENEIGNYIEIRTNVPEAAQKPTENGDSPVTSKCLSIVKCVRHDHGHCTKYNSVTVTVAAELSQGAYVRLKDCDSNNLVSQRFQFTPEADQTPPPTRFPTPKPPEQTLAPTTFPTKKPTETETTLSPTSGPTPPPVAAPTKSPVVVDDQFPPTVSDGESNGNDVNVVSDNSKAGLKAGLAFVGVLCLAVIVVGAAYYYKHKGDFQQLPEEDENFIARV